MVSRETAHAKEGGPVTQRLGVDAHRGRLRGLVAESLECLRRVGAGFSVHWTTRSDPT